MRINNIQNYSVTKNSLVFGAGVTNLYSDFDGTFMPYEFRHDAICGNPDKSDLRYSFLNYGGKDRFKNYFESFNKLIKKIKGRRGDKFNFTITSGRNRHEFNHYIKRIKEDGLTVPVPEKIIVRNGSDIYTKRTDLRDFFKSNAEEIFLKDSFVQTKRDEIKTAANWDGDKVKELIKGVLKDKTKHGELTLLDVKTEGGNYAYGMNIYDTLEKMSPPPKKYAAIKDNGNLEFQLYFPKHMGDKESLEEFSMAIAEKLKKEGVEFISKSYVAEGNKSFGELSISPKIGGSGISKLFDTKKEVQRIVAEKLDDLVIVAGDDGNDRDMLNLFNYIGKNRAPEVYDAETMRKIYDMPVISIYVDNSAAKGKSTKKISGYLSKTFDEIDNYFNSDGNIRFIHVIPDNNVGKPKTLQEGIQLAIREYAKRNEAFRKNLPQKTREVIESMTYEYPIDKSISENLEAATGIKLWNPAPALKEITSLKKYSAIAFGVGSTLTLGTFAIKKMKQKKNSTKNQTTESITPDSIINMKLSIKKG